MEGGQDLGGTGPADMQSVMIAQDNGIMFNPGYFA